jgi:putative copper resistance protein D
VIAVAAGLAVCYGAGVRRLGRRGRRWPAGRSAAFGAGVLVLAGSQLVPETSFTGHMTGHVLLGMAAPLLLGLGAPVTLALQSVTRPARRRLLRAMQSSPARAVVHPVFGLALFGATLVALYLSPVFSLSLRNPVVHGAVHLHFVAAGCVFLWPLAGTDPLPRALPHGARILVVLAAVPFHAFLGVALLSTRVPLAPAVYPSLADQRAAAGLLWASGELMTLVTAGIVLRAWMAADGRDAARFDRRLDRVAAP